MVKKELKEFRFSLSFFAFPSDLFAFLLLFLRVYSLTFEKRTIAHLQLIIMKKITFSLLLLILSVGISLAQSHKMAALTEELNEMLLSDQQYRVKISFGTLEQEFIDSIYALPDGEQMNFHMNNKKKLPKATEDSLWAVQNAIDLANINRLQEIVCTYGWPAREKFQLKTSALLFLTHCPTEKVEKMKELLYTEVKEGRMGSLEYAMFVDNMLLKHGEMQLYGTNKRFDRELKKVISPSLKDIEASNKARIDIGLEPLKEGEYRIK